MPGLVHFDKALTESRLLLAGSNSKITRWQLIKILSALLEGVMELNPATWPLLLKMCFLFGPFLVMFSGMGMITYMACRDLARVLDGFSQSQIITSYADAWRGGSLVARYTVMSIMISAVLWPGKHLRKGHLNAEELNRVPVSIKRRMQVSAGLLIFGFVWFAGFFVLDELYE